MKYPILEFDSTPEAFIEPSKVIRKTDMPEYCVISFFNDIIEKIVKKQNAKVLVENSWSDGPHPVYEIEYKNNRLAIFHPGIGGQLAAALLEEVIAFGCRKFIACGGCGVLDRDIAAGYLIVVSSALRDEGVSYHYIAPSREIAANPIAMKALEEEIQKHGVPFKTGKTWTMAAPYRETANKIAKRRKEGCLVVEMEAASCSIPQRNNIL